MLPDMERDGNRLKELREAEGLSTADVAVLTHRGTSITVDRWEKGLTAMPDDAKLILAKRFDVTVEHLMGWDTAPAKTGVTA